jgi:hypothetical protein
MSGGFELIAKLSANKAHLKIIAVSMGLQNVLDTAISRGADTAVPKLEPGAPVDARRWLFRGFPANRTARITVPPSDDHHRGERVRRLFKLCRHFTRSTILPEYPGVVYWVTRFGGKAPNYEV